MHFNFYQSLPLFVNSSSYLYVYESIAFWRHGEASISGIENHFSKLQKLLEAERKWNKIVDARNKAGFTEDKLHGNKDDDEPHTG